MALMAAVGIGEGLEGRAAGAQAARYALDQLGGIPVQFGFVLSSHAYEIQSVLSGVSSLLGNTPLMGMSTSGFLASASSASRAVQVLLLAGQDLKARADWWPGFSDSGLASARKVISELDLVQSPADCLILAGDGLRGNAAELAAALGPGRYPLVGLLASGDVQRDSTAQLGGSSAGNGGLAAAWLSGDIHLGIGHAHGWQVVGPNFKLTHVRECDLRTLDDRPASEVYAGLLGNEAAAWKRPPLNYLVRLYPLGLEPVDGKDLDLLAPLRVLPDGSLRLNTVIAEGRLGYLMTGSPAAFLEAARQAARQALDKLGDSFPRAALVFADQAWAYQFEGYPGALSAALEDELGANLPVTGGYTLGQLLRPMAGATPELRQGEILVVVLGEEID
jgi:hypothetical protein